MRQRFQAAEGQLRVIRSQAVELVKKASGDTAYNDVNYVFPTFVTTQLPPGLVGLIIAAIFAAAMSSIAAELNSLSTATLIDFYKRHLKPEATDRHYMTVSWISTAVWGVIACGVAIFATNLGSLIEVVNRFGSFFYGSLLGVFVLAIGTKRATGTGAFIGLIAGMAAVAFVAFRYPAISFLWHNVVGVVVVVVVGMAISLVTGRTSSSRP
jgi:Na+/proline symporter